MLAEHEYPVPVEPQNSFRINTLIPGSIPATPGPSTAANDRALPNFKTNESEENVVPPERPQSTPFPVQEMNDRDIYCTHCRLDTDDMKIDSAQPFTSSIKTESAPLCNLPSEIHEYILDYLLGVRESAALKVTSAGKSKFVRGWGSALRHSRRQEVSQLALVSRTWRDLIQERMYRHLKIRGTRNYVNDAIDWFKSHSHLRSYIRHIDIWFPVFQQKNHILDPTLRITSNLSDRSLLNLPSSTDFSLPVTYQSPSDNCTIEQVFRFIQKTFDKVCILTLEGGERKKPPMVRYFQQRNTLAQLPILPSVRTLVCKGQWNIIRSNTDFQNLVNALPNLNEWHAFYSKPKSKSYLSMATILPKLPRYLTHLNICLEADYRREAFIPEYAKKVSRKTHFCVEMARAIPTLEHLAYTGRICHEFFSTAALLSDPRESRLRTVDIVVKNVCRPSLPELGWGDGSSITDMKFITAFEKLVVAAIQSLGRLTAVELLRIRFIDLESQIPGLNPYFQYNKDYCTGIWSESIVESLFRSRPAAFFVEKPEILDDLKIGQLFTNSSFSKSRPLCIRVSQYACLVNGINIT